MDGLVLNLSCPNVPSVVSLNSDDDDTKNLLLAVLKERNESCKDTPVLIKVSPDMSDFARNKIVKLAIQCGIDGIIVSNTSTDREG